MQLNNKVYDVMKWMTILFIPAVGTLYFALSGIWGFPYGEEVVGTLTAIEAFLGTILGLSSINYKGDGELVAGENPEDDFALLVNKDPSELKNGTKMVLTLKK